MTGEQIWGVIRTIGAAVGGWAVGKGYIDNDMLTAVLGGGGTIFVAVWSWWSKKSSA